MPLQGVQMSDSIRRKLPGGKTVSTASAYMQGWRDALEPLCILTGWVIHSFLPDGVLIMSPDMKHKQTVTREFIEAYNVGTKIFPVRPNGPMVIKQEGQINDPTSRELRNDTRAQGAPRRDH